ncbi:hypothetical protein FKM82_026133 [Ascaphus truei]
MLNPLLPEEPATHCSAAPLAAKGLTLYCKALCMDSLYKKTFLILLYRSTTPSVPSTFNALHVVGTLCPRSCLNRCWQVVARQTLAGLDV